jgi:membrane protein
MGIPGLRGMTLRRFLREVARSFGENQLKDVASQLAYASLLAIFPFAIFVFTVIGYLPVSGAESEIYHLIHTFVPQESAVLIDGVLESATAGRSGTLLALSRVGSMWAASGGVAALAAALNRAYGVRETRSWIHVRLESFALTIFGAVVVIVGTVSLLVGPELVGKVEALLHAGHSVSRLYGWLRWPSVVLAMSMMLALLYWACPNVKHSFRFLTAGSLTAVPLWIASSLLFNVYVSRLGAGSLNRTYGALGAGVVLILWMYVSGFIVLLGGAMNAVVERSEWERARPRAPGRAGRDGEGDATRGPSPEMPDAPEAPEPPPPSA